MSYPPLYNSRIISTFVKLVERKYPRVDLSRVLRDAGIERYQVSDEGHWFTQPEVDLFVQRLVLATGNPEICREAGQFVASSESLGTIRKYLIGLIGPANAFSAVNKATSTLLRSSTYQSRRLAPNKVEIVVTPKEGIQESPYQCQNRIGSWEGILTMFNCSATSIEHPACIFAGDPVCRYLISWKEPLYLRVRTARNYLALFIFSALAVIAPFVPAETFTRLLPGGLILLLAATCLVGRLENSYVNAALASLKESTDELLDQTGTNYNNAVMVNQVGQAISKQAGIDEVLDNVIKALENRLSYDRGMILLANPDKTTLAFRTGFGYTDEELSLLRETCFGLDNHDSRGVFTSSFREQRSILIDDFSQVAEDHSPRSQEFAQRIEASSFLCCPIVCEGESLGILAVDNIRSKRALVQSDLSLMMGIAPMIGISIRNAIYIERERQRAEQMRESQKMEAVGQLAGGVAHDFNNLLTAIIGFASLAQLSTDRTSPAMHYLDEVLLASERATHLTQGLLAFSRKQAMHPQPVDLNRIVERMEKLLRRLISEEIDLVLSFGAAPLPVVADAGQIDQIIMNLATNARDAMRRAGTLTIETGRVELSEEMAAQRGQGTAGPYARLSVVDTGQGMDEATKARIFEPFFTTKEVGKGTGLGLAIVYGIVKQHNGFIDIQSAPGQGTRFNLMFPLRQQAGASPEPVVGRQAAAGGSDTIMVVEDAEEVRRLTREVLESHGYRVIEAVDGEDAVQKFRLNQDTVKLVIMDVVMPKLSGREAYARIAEIRPETKVLFTSGYAPDDLTSKGIQFDSDNFLSKPSPPQALLRRVADLLNPGSLNSAPLGQGSR